MDWWLHTSISLRSGARRCSPSGGKASSGGKRFILSMTSRADPRNDPPCRFLPGRDRGAKDPDQQMRDFFGQKEMVKLISG